jgi:hydroxymethylbilane synthase
MVQSRLAAQALSARHPEHDFVLAPMATRGDRAAGMRLAEAPQEGVFVKELEDAILSGRAELAVHSAKDLPTRETPGLEIAAYLPRADPRDVLVGRGPVTLAALPRGARVGTGSPRRSAQLLAIRPDLKVVPIRGNVDTRLRRLAEGAVDALVLAGAGLERLDRIDESVTRLALEAMLPAPGQGALAIQAASGSPAAALAAQVDDADTRRAVEAERAVLRGLGGGCLSAVGVHARVEGRELAISAGVLAEDGARVARMSARGADDARVVAEVVDGLERRGAAGLLGAPAGALAGLRVMVTRPAEQAGPFEALLREAGADVLLCPLIAIEPLPVPDAFEARLGDYDWIVFTSANGVDRLFEVLSRETLPDSVRVAAIGPETAARLEAHAAPAQLVPENFVAEDLAGALEAKIEAGSRVLLARAQGARDVLPERLRRRGAVVDVVELYRAVPPPGLPERLRRLLEAGVDVITLTSSSTARHLVEALQGRALPPGVQVACIGPITAGAARELGLRVDIIAEEYTARGLRDALVRARIDPRAATGVEVRHELSD